MQPQETTENVEIATEPPTPVVQKPRRRPVDDDLGAPSNDIVALIKPRSDWWDSGPLSSPVRGVATTSKDSSFDNFILSIPLPSYAFLGMSVILAISFVGSIFQLFYGDSSSSVLGAPITTAILVLSGPTWVLLFVAAIKKGQVEADEDDGLPY